MGDDEDRMGGMGEGMRGSIVFGMGMQRGVRGGLRVHGTEYFGYV